MRKIFRHVGIQSLVYGIGNISNSLVSFLLLPLYTRHLSTAEYGILSLVNIFAINLMYLFDLGMTNALFRSYFSYGEDNAEGRKIVLSTTVFFMSVTGAFLSLFFLAISPLLSKLVFRDPIYTPLIVLVTFITFFGAIATVPYQLLRIKEQAIKFLIISLTRAILSVVFIYVWFVGWQGGLNGILAARLVATVVFFLLVFFVAPRVVYFQFSFQVLKGMLAFGLPFLPVLFATWILDYSNRYILERLTNLDQVGVYSLGYTLGQAVMIMVTAFSTAWPPIMYKLADKENCKEIYARVLTYFSTLTLAVALGLAMFSREVLVLFATPAYYEAAKVVLFVSLAYTFYGIYRLLLTGIYLTKKTANQPAIIWLAAFVNIALTIWLVPRIGMIGAALAMTLAYLLVAVLTFFVAQTYYPIQFEYSRLVKLIVAFQITYSLSLTVHTSNIWMSLALKFLVFMVFPLVLTLLNFLLPQERRVLRELIFAKL